MSEKHALFRENRENSTKKRKHSRYGPQTERERTREQDNITVYKVSTNHLQVHYKVPIE